ncbi:MAG TPA: sugar-binding transcriptional regulator [Propionicimonas sp.]|nr:sugar-binding transcriptional regulator [Propionicimonas sp.]HRA06504.1 sugar-binding transcriptional regulator [Propionicimonas sp.]
MATPGTQSQQRLMVRVAKMYYEHGDRQPQIAQQLHISQAKVSRLLKRAEELGIVRVTIHAPLGGYSDLEEALVARYDLADAIVVEANSDEESEIVSAVGGAAAAYLSDVLLGHERIGISSWSATLLAMVNAMPQSQRSVADSVIQVIGGVGEPQAQVQATRLTEQLATLTGASPQFLPAPGFVSSAELRSAFLAEPYVKAVADSWPKLSILLAGIGSLEPSPLLRESGNAIPHADQAELRGLGAVGDVCLRFFDAEGAAVHSSIEDRVIGISTEDLRKVPRRVGVAGGARKHSAVRAALLGQWVNVLVTDTRTADALLA